MKSKLPTAMTTQSLAHAAGRKTRRVQKKLHEAEEDMRSAAQDMANGSPGAAEHSAAAERKVHEAAEELEVVRQMLDDAEAPAQPQAGAGASGDGVKSLLPHLQRRR